MKNKNLKNWLFGGGLVALAGTILKIIEKKDFITSQFDDAASVLWLSGFLGCVGAFATATVVNILQKEPFNPKDVFRTTYGALVAWPLIALIGLGSYLHFLAGGLIATAVIIHFKK